MSYKINYKAFSDHLRVSISGHGNKEAWAKVSGDISGLLDKYGLKDILIDLRNITGRLSVFDSVEHIDNYSYEMKLRRYAVVDKPEHKEQNRFFENAACNRGYRIYFFTDEAPALKWLNVAETEEAESVLEKEY